MHHLKAAGALSSKSPRLALAEILTALRTDTGRDVSMARDAIH